MERIYYFRKGRKMNIKENLYIYLYKHNNNTPIDEQKADENSHNNALFGKAIQYTETPARIRAYKRS
jgi:hypothetical protein